jgi:RNA polymerase sigma factor (sigma-70 family)
MTNNDRTTLTRYLRRTLRLPEAGGLADAQLLERFVADRDEAAFEVLVWRHGPKVLGVCRRMLHHDQDAEDAFQATFIILVRKARSIAKGQSLSSWLHRVAYRVALRARMLTQQRTARQKPLSECQAAQGGQDAVWSDLRPVLDEEVDRLPAKYRAPFVLCYFDGKTNEQAARELGCPKGTILSRLAWARHRLRMRLTSRGLALTCGLVGTAAGPDVAEAAVPAMLVGSTVRTALLIAAGQTTAIASRQVAILTQGVLHAMLWTKVKAGLSWVMLVGVLTLVGGVAARQTPNATLRPDQATNEKPKSQSGPEQKTYSFEMRSQPWRKVLEWYSDNSGMLFTGKVWPAGNFTYIPPKNKKHTLVEITDILNEAMLAENHILLRGAASFTVVPADERLDPTFLPRVPIDDLGKRGKTELVTVLITLGKLSAMEMAPTIKKLMGPFGDVIVVEKTNQLLLADTAMNLISIHKTIQELQGAAKKKAP